MGGCTRFKAYRTSLDAAGPCPATQASDCPEEAYFHRSWPAENGRGPEEIPIAIIEFDDHGVLHDRALKDEIMEKIRQRIRPKDADGALVVVFAHGWLNNASPDNRSLAKFQEMLQSLSRIDDEICGNRTCACRKVLGVYLAWRGLSTKVVPLNLMSFWNRKGRAHRIGQDGAVEVIAELRKMQAGKQKNFKKGKDGCGDPIDNSRLIVIGHSFGGALIYTSAQQLFMKELAGEPLMKELASQESAESVRRTVADLVVLVNPAFEAARLTALLDRAARMTFPKTQSPILAIFTSENDSATKRAFPAGRRLANLFRRYHRPEQARLDRTAVGHYAGYRTHELCLQEEDEQLTLEESVCEWERFRGGETPQWDIGSVVLRRTAAAGPSDNPYYNVAVSREIIPGHAGIWDPDFMGFIARFVAVQEARPCEQYLPEWRHLEAPPAREECPSGRSAARSRGR